MSAVWLPVTGYEGVYEVSSLGELRRGERVLAAPVDRLGYVKAFLGDKNRPDKHTTMHRIVAHAFLGTPLRPRMQVNHINGIKTDNRPENLEWVTAAENVQHAVATGLFASRGERHHLAKLGETQVSEIRAARAAGVSLKELARDYGVSLSTISAASTGRTWKSA